MRDLRAADLYDQQCEPSPAEHAALLLFAIRQQGQDGRTRHRHATRDAMMSRPCAILVLQLDELGFDIAVPFLPFRAAGAVQAVADVQIGEKLFAAHGAEPGDETRIRKPTGDLLDFGRILPSILLGPAELLEFLRSFVERNAGTRNRGLRDTPWDTAGHTPGHTPARYGAQTAADFCGFFRVVLNSGHGHLRHGHSLLLRRVEAARGH